MDGRFGKRKLSDEVVARMRGRSHREPCPVALDELALLDVAHLDAEGLVLAGQLVVHAALADEVLEIFAELLAARFPLARVRLVDHYDGDDERSMADNNTSAFNVRPNVTNPSRPSWHAFGAAIDVNPLWNPYVADKILPPAAAAYVDRSARRPGMILRGDACHAAFVRRGWTWGGDWVDRVDYQHFEKIPARGQDP